MSLTMKATFFLTALLLASIAEPALASFAIFMKVDGITGDSANDKYTGDFDVQAVSSGVSLPDGAVKAQFADLSVLIHLSRGTPNLLVAAAQGTHIATVEIDFANGSNTMTFYKIVLSDVLISGIKETGAIDTTNAVPTDLVTFRYSKIEWTYTTITPAGAAGGTTSGGWDLTKNTKS